MRRRDVLRATALGAGATLTVTAGCLSGETPIDAPADDPEDGGTDGGSKATSEGSSSPGGRRLEVDRIETPPDAVRLNHLGSTPAGQVPTVDSLSASERDVARAALDGGYETDDEELPGWLVAFVAETPYLRRDGVYYRLEHDFPRYTITAEETTEAAIEGRIADPEAYREAVTHDGVRQTALLHHARNEGVTRVALQPSLREFLRTYDAVRYRGSLLSVSLTVTDDGPPYEVSAGRVAPTDLVDEPVYDAADASDRIREVVRAAGRTEGVYAGDLPEELLDAVATHQYVYLDGTFYWAGLENRGDLPVDVEAAVVRPPMSEAEASRLRLALVNGDDREVSVFSGAPPPFGVLRVEAVNGDGESLLWTDAYRENTHVGTEGRSVTFVEDIGLTTSLPAGERLERTFAVVDVLDPGEYVVRSTVVIDTAGDGGGTLPYRVYLRVIES
jgi:hypothetical protein